MAHLKKKNYKSATWCLHRARRTLRYRPLYSSLFARYSGSTRKWAFPAAPWTSSCTIRRNCRPRRRRARPRHSCPFVPRRSRRPSILAVDSDQRSRTPLKRLQSRQQDAGKAGEVVRERAHVQEREDRRQMAQTATEGQFRPRHLYRRAGPQPECRFRFAGQEGRAQPGKIPEPPVFKNSYFALEHKERAL